MIFGVCGGGEIALMYIDYFFLNKNYNIQILAI